ncbi:AAA family ATPase [Frateuria sp. YIM B11624]|uniref:AAA family ATPase n=1 Tax=Frateuria sp. YIM B11624 TaxID=3143185 RepID=UPI003C75AA76
MIKSVTIQGHKSFSPATPTTIDFVTTKRVALLYGLNGAGKSAIGEVIHHNGNNQEPFAQCSVDTTHNVPYQFLVYNEEFIESTFRNRSDMPGIFTIGKPEAAALEQAEALEKQARQWRIRIDQITEQLVEREQEAERNHTAILDAVWSVYTDHKNGPLKEWLMGFGGAKQRVFDQLSATPFDLSETPLTVEELIIRTNDVSDRTAVTRSEVSVDVTGFDGIEGDALWGQAIVGSGDSTLAAQIQALGNMDWVRQGRSFLGHDSHCPFCQQNLPHNFSNELARLFDTSFETRVQEVQQRTELYRSKVTILSRAVENVLEHEPFAKGHSNLERVWAQTQLTLSENVSSMERKCSSPGHTISLKPSREDLEALRVAVAQVNDRVIEFNVRVRDRSNELIRIKNGFWARMRHDHSPAINVYKTSVDAIRQAVDSMTQELDGMKRCVADAERQLVELRRNTAGTDKAVEAINGRLASLGVDAFKIMKANANQYRLTRSGGAADNYRSLSEGEKTLITFLYFVELINGSAVADTTTPLDRKIVVIDDPISSLSHNYVYDIASIIAHDIIDLEDEDGKQLKQVIVLTHSLFFHHELIHVGPSHKQIDFKRVVKHDHSSVVPMLHTDLLNDYEAYWQVIKDAKTGHATPIMVANAMRGICERFFYFTRRQNDFKEALKRIGQQDYRFSALARYLNRQSHADAENLTDFGDYDVTYYLNKFRLVFDQTQHMDHYRAMLGENDEPGQAEGEQVVAA